jgi:hypothetical protein
MSKHHKVKSHHWYDGILKTVEHTFENLADALAHVSATNPHAAKVYNESGDLVHVESSLGKPVPSTTNETYA